MKEDPYSPLGPYPDQNVISDLRVDGKPAFRPHELVTVEGRKCVEEDVEVFGTQVWQSVDPSGRALQVGNGTRFAEEGCTDLEYSNEIPPEVAEKVRQQHAAGNPYPVWKITGIETPINAETGENGESMTWETEPLVLVGEGPNS